MRRDVPRGAHGCSGVYALTFVEVPPAPLRRSDAGQAVPSRETATPGTPPNPPLRPCPVPASCLSVFYHSARGDEWAVDDGQPHVTAGLRPEQEFGEPTTASSSPRSKIPTNQPQEHPFPPQSPSPVPTAPPTARWGLGRAGVAPSWG